MTLHIVTDLDGVVYDFVTAIGDHAADTLGGGRHTFRPARQWNFHEDWGLTLDQFLTLVRDSYDTGRLFWTGTPLAGAVEGWARLAALNDKIIHVVSDRPVDLDGAATRHWLARHGFTFDHIDLTADKVTAVRTVAATVRSTRIVTVDDRDTNHAAYEAAGFDAWLLTRPWNDHVTTTRRVRDLAEFADRVTATASRTS
jgi:hypothetical protein